MGQLAQTCRGISQKSGFESVLGLLCSSHYAALPLNGKVRGRFRAREGHKQSGASGRVVLCGVSAFHS